MDIELRLKYKIHFDKALEDRSLEELMQTPVAPEPPKRSLWEKFKGLFKGIPLLWRYRK